MYSYTDSAVQVSAAGSNEKLDCVVLYRKLFVKRNLPVVLANCVSKCMLGVFLKAPCATIVN